MNDKTLEPEKINGPLFALMAFFVWGIVPIYWKQLSHLGFQEVLSHRILWSSIFLGIFIFYKNETKEFYHSIKSKKTFGLLVITTLLIVFNWNLYIWAVTNGYIVEGSLGYFLNPIINVLLGVVFLGEKLKKAHWVAVILASIAIIILFSQHVGRPEISVGLAISFALYGFIRKKLSVKSYHGQFFEATLLLPLVLIHFGYLISQGEFHFISMATNTERLMLIGGGLVTALPLIWFAIAVSSMPLSVVGLFQYIAPTLQLMVGVLVYHEPFTKTHFLAFSLIWLGLIIYSIDQLRRNYKRKR